MNKILTAVFVSYNTATRGASISSQDYSVLEDDGADRGTGLGNLRESISWTKVLIDTL
jgi:hypothetical protein